LLLLLLQPSTAKTYVHFDAEDFALLLQARWTVGRYETLSDGRQKLVSFAGHISSRLDDLTARSSQVRTWNHL